MEEPLAGNVTNGIVRIGDTMRRPAGPWTDAVDALLCHLRDVGFMSAPRALGRDARGRQVLEYVPGELGAESGTYSLAELASIGRMLTDLHHAACRFRSNPARRWGNGSRSSSPASLTAGDSVLSGEVPAPTATVVS
jgi:hypothetical protein